MCGNGHEGGQTARGKELGATAITQEGVIDLLLSPLPFSERHVFRIMQYVACKTGFFHLLVCI